ncbi:MULTISPECIES: response regulator [unclassified Pseudoalteromonas]|uniref:response regulator n=1 Tax=unclassified Pseudoalteromonas TaxID=194690 RepID=UPI000EEB8C6C|nr:MULTISPECIES: response regulator [unclassified Pseudoalteromonas]HAG40147.1 two-component system sensor histidine kinase/response regulator [Pseudoalteromonas sp.]|tara:strand:- start:3103 stop:4827 length:1725 start_codon:yes stop_codon:yes gene_type:complete
MFKIIANVRQRYRWALIAIALLISGSALLLQYGFSVQKYDAKIINMAGKQRMLSQKIAWHSNALLSSRIDIATHTNSLEHSLAQFKTAHEVLLTKQGSSYRYLTPELVKLYFAEPANLDSEVNEFIAQASWLLYQKGEVDTQVLNVAHVENLLAKLDRAVTLFEQHAVKKVNRVSNLELLCWLVAMVLLLVELRFVFMPMEKEVERTLTALQKQKDFVAQMSQNKEHFIARASHEFRTPLQGLITSIDELTIDSEQQNIKTQASYCALRLLSMLDELQDLQALSTGKWAPILKNENLLESINKVVLAYEYAAQQKGLTLITHFDESLNCFCKLDHQRLQHVLTELISNAIKFTDKGEVEVAANMQNSQLQLTVNDSGCGFSSEITELEFDSFKQTNHFQGLRTGLTRAQYVVKALHGSLSFKNNAASGAHVTLNLPIEITNQQTEREVEKKLFCLVVEDNELNTLLLTRILATLGVDYECVVNGLEACEKVGKAHYDVVFMDLNMPVMDGFEATKKIRKELNKTMPIIVVTANTSAEDMDLIYEYGASEHIHKPISKQAVADALVNVCIANEIN